MTKQGQTSDGAGVKDLRTDLVAATAVARAAAVIAPAADESLVAEAARAFVGVVNLLTVERDRSAKLERTITRLRNREHAAKEQYQQLELEKLVVERRTAYVQARADHRLRLLETAIILGSGVGFGSVVALFFGLPMGGGAALAFFSIVGTALAVYSRLHAVRRQG